MIDTIDRFDGTHVKMWGGITYSLLTFAKLAPPQTRIQPVCKVGKKVAPIWMELLQQFPTMDLRGVQRTGRNHHNVLRYKTPEERQESFQPGDHTLTFQDLEPFLEADAFYINVLFPEDLSLETLRTFSFGTTGWLYLDIHSWVRVLDPVSRTFVPRPFPHPWQQVIALVDLVQMNQEELGALIGMEIQTPEQEKALVKWMLQLGPKVVLVTHGSGPVTMGVREGTWVRIVEAQPDAVPAKDPTGCGDVFGAAFFMEWIRTENADLALEKAMKIARLHALREWIPEAWLTFPEKRAEETNSS